MAILSNLDKSGLPAPNEGYAKGEETRSWDRRSSLRHRHLNRFGIWLTARCTVKKDMRQAIK